jgi:hypothetical protein
MTINSKKRRSASLVMLFCLAAIAENSAQGQVVVRIADGMTVEATNVGIALTGSIDASGIFDTRGATISFNQTDGSGGIELTNGLGFELVDASQFEGTTINGPVQLKGTLRIRVAPATVIEEGAIFDVLTCSGGCSDTFDEVESPFAVSVQYAANSVTVHALESFSTATNAPNLSVPHESRLLAAYPNPFTYTTTLRVDADAPGALRIEAFDLLGRRVDLVTDGFVSGGSHELKWSAPGLASGVYLLRAHVDQRVIGVWRVMLRR